MKELLVYWLSSVERLGPRHFETISSHFPELKAVFSDPYVCRSIGFSEDLCRAMLRRANLDMLQSELVHMRRMGIRITTIVSDDYPPLLKETVGAPIVLYYKGSLAQCSGNTFAIVGTRSPTRNGIAHTKEISKELAAAGVCIVSGMARGIDAAAHAGALETACAGAAVLGCGVDVIYPRENQKLYDGLCEQGAVISEYPPATLPTAGNFPPRNRIISGMCRGILVAEGAKKSGASITASFAAEQSRDVFALPGDIGLPQARLPNSLIAEGAILVEGTHSICSYYGWEQNKSSTVQKESIQLDFSEQRLYNLLMTGDLMIDELAEQAAMPPNDFFSAITLLELSGLIERLPGNRLHAVNRFPSGIK